MLRKIVNRLFFFNSTRAELRAVQSQIREENRKFCIIWSVVYVIFWAYCLFMSFNAPLYRLCRDIYIYAFAASVVSLGLSLFAAPKHPWLTRLIAIVLDEVLLLSGILIARNLAPQTIVIFAAVLIVPVLFITDTFSTILMLVLNILALMLIGSGRMEPDTFSWVLSNLGIFSILGLMLGHFVNKARFERYVFAESNAEYARIQARNAQYDQLTDLKNRRAYADDIDLFANNLPADCIIVLADINGLKQTNDTYGHAAGDELIIGAAECVRKSFTGTDRIYRIGGDEFAVIITEPGYDIEGALNRLTATCAAWEGQYIHGIFMSAGYASAKEFPDMDSLEKAADKRMYAAKRAFYEKAGNDRRSR